MNLFTTIIGGMIGGAIAGLPGAMIGAAIGSMAGEESQQQKGRKRTYQRRRGGYSFDDEMDYKIYQFSAEITLGVMIAKADGRFVESEKEAILQRYRKLGLNSSQMTLIKNLVNQAERSTASLDDVCDELKMVLNRNDKQHLMLYIFSIMVADRVIDDREIELARKIAIKLEIPSSIFEQMLHAAKQSIGAEFGNQQKGSSSSYSYRKQNAPAYGIIGVSPTADWSEIRKAYLKLVKEYHPDRFASMDQSKQEFAKIKFQEIQQAYEDIKKERGQS